MNPRMYVKGKDVLSCAPPCKILHLPLSPMRDLCVEARNALDPRKACPKRRCSTVTHPRPGKRMRIVLSGVVGGVVGGVAKGNNRSGNRLHVRRPAAARTPQLPTVCPTVGEGRSCVWPEGELGDGVFDFEAAVGEMFKNYKCTSAKKNIICRYWLRKRCFKGDDECEYLHSLTGLMPWCKHGDQCKERDTCQFRHKDESEKVAVCPNYEAGFCRFGPACHNLHVKKTRAELPRVAQLILDIVAGKKVVARVLTDAWKTSLCKAFEEGKCKFGAACNFAHGPTDLRGRGKDRLKRDKWYDGPDGVRVWLDASGVWWLRKTRDGEVHDNQRKQGVQSNQDEWVRWGGVS